MQAALKVTFSNITIIKSSVARLDDFWKLSATKFLAKEAQMIGNFLGYFEKPHSYVKNYIGYFLGNFWKKLGRVVVSNTRSPRFKYSHNQEFILNIFTVNCWKDEKIEKEAGNGPY